MHADYVMENYICLEVDPAGTIVASSFCYATPEDWGKLGLLLLQDGVWQNERILPKGYVDIISTARPGSGGHYGGRYEYFTN